MPSVLSGSSNRSVFFKSQGRARCKKPQTGHKRNDPRQQLVLPSPPRYWLPSRAGRLIGGDQQTPPTTRFSRQGVALLTELLRMGNIECESLQNLRQSALSRHLARTFDSALRQSQVSITSQYARLLEPEVPSRWLEDRLQYQHFLTYFRNVGSLLVLDTFASLRGTSGLVLVQLQPEDGNKGVHNEFVYRGPASTQSASVVHVIRTPVGSSSSSLRACRFAVCINRTKPSAVCLVHPFAYMGEVWQLNEDLSQVAQLLSPSLLVPGIVGLVLEYGASTVSCAEQTVDPLELFFRSRPMNVPPPCVGPIYPLAQCTVS